VFADTLSGLNESVAPEGRVTTPPPLSVITSAAVERTGDDADGVELGLDMGAVIVGVGPPQPISRKATTKTDPGAEASRPSRTIISDT
jgi:hypothetical protein